MEEENRKTQILMKDIQDALVKFKEIKGVDLEVEDEAMVMVEGMEEDMMVIIKVIAGVNVVSEAKLGKEVIEEVMVEGITIKPQNQNQENNQTQGNQCQAQNQNQTNDSDNAEQSTGHNNQGKRRGPFCFHCERSSADFNHWPYKCDWLKAILDDWHANLNVTGHQRSQHVSN